ncbi:MULTISPECIES: hypothetical protein [unclassified Fibrobacter]|uniref:hypothetical protein n=1 Tax=unclassified Fibrobacter TaxID=2634177 RepID=UPI000D6DA6C4|nr:MULTISPECIES: hypothetical protein [unclassified Fibrobacter]PWJ60748.1 hypothetical protein BGX12_13618 [Fibrobacter sp. UWR4]PZW64364.1 hypothetical protein C8E88_103818 [Fibrobacter sp. UWR1]
MRKLILLLLVFVTLGYSQTRYLHVSTIPAKADIFVGNSAPDYSKFPDHTSPAFIPVDSSESQVLIAIFHPEFTDTLINVNLPADKDTSYLIVSLKPSYDDRQIKRQQKILSRRSNRNLGRGIMLSSIIPLAVAATSTAITLHQINLAEDARKILKNSAIASGEKYDEAKQDFKDARSTAKTARNVSIGSAVGAALLLSAGFIISF